VLSAVVLLPSVFYFTLPTTIMAEIKVLGETKLIYGGFIYVRSKLPINGKTYWECQQLRRK